MKDMKNSFAGVDQSAYALNRLLEEIVIFGSSNPKKALREREKQNWKNRTKTVYIRTQNQKIKQKC